EGAVGRALGERVHTGLVPGQHPEGTRRHLRNEIGAVPRRLLGEGQQAPPRLGIFLALHDEEADGPPDRSRQPCHPRDLGLRRADRIPRCAAPGTSPPALPAPAPPPPHPPPDPTPPL